jgi:hypothetical protein
MRFVLSGTAIISCVALHGNEICNAEGAVAAELEAVAQPLLKNKQCTATRFLVIEASRNGFHPGSVHKTLRRVNLLVKHTVQSDVSG